MPAPTFQMSYLDWLKLIFLSFLWGLSFIFMEVAIQELGTFTVAFARAAIAALALNIIILLRGQTLWQYRQFLGAFFIMGLVGIAIPFSLIIWGQIYITASLSAILNGTLPFFTLLTAHFFTNDEKMTPRRIAALAIGFIGVVVIIGPTALSNQIGTKNMLGQVAVLGATFCYSITIIYGRHFMKRGVPGLVIATGQMSIAALVLLPFVIWEAPWLLSMPSVKVWGALIALGLLSTALAFTLWYHLLSRIGSNNTSLVTFLIPASAITLGYILLGEVLSLNQIIGMGIVACGLIIIDGRLWARVSVKKN